MEKRIVSKRWTLKTRDWAISLFQAVALPVLVLLQQKIDSGEFNLNMKELGMIAAGAAVVHLIRKLTEASKVIEIKKI